MSSPRLWTRPFLMGTGINFLLILNYYLLMVVMAEYAAEQFHVSDSSAGLAASLFVIGVLVARFYSAKLMERLGQKGLLLLGVFLEILVSLSYFLARDLWVLYLIRLMHGISYGMASTSISTLVTGSVPKERHGEGIGYFMLSVTMGAAIGPFFGIFLLKHGGYRSIFMVCAAVVVLCGGLALWLRTPRREPSRDGAKALPKADNRVRGLKAIFEVRAVPISLICAGIYFCYSGIISFLSSYAQQIQLQTAAEFFFVIYSLVILLTRPMTGRLFDRRGEFVVMLPAFLSFVVGMVLFSQATYGLVLWAAAALLGFGIGVIQSCGLAIAVRESPRERISYANSTFYALIDIGTGVGPFLLGFLIPVTGFRNMYLCLAGVALIVMGLYWVIRRGGRKRAERSL